MSEVSSKLLEVGVVLQGGGALDAMNADALNAHWRGDGFRLARLGLVEEFGDLGFVHEVLRMVVRDVGRVARAKTT